MSELLYVQALSTRSARDAVDMYSIFEEKLNKMKMPSLIVLPEYFIDGPELLEGKKITDPMVTMMEKYSKYNGTHIVSGMVEVTEEGSKHITGLLFGPTKGLIGKRRKAYPTTPEIEKGVTPGEETVRTFTLENGIGTLVMAMGIESYELDIPLRTNPAEILANPRGSLDDERFGNLSADWLAHNQDLAKMGRKIVAGATGRKNQPGALAEIIDSEGRIFDSSHNSGAVIEAYIDMEKLREYRAGKIVSQFVPFFSNRFSEE